MSVLVGYVTERVRFPTPRSSLIRMYWEFPFTRLFWSCSACGNKETHLPVCSGDYSLLHRLDRRKRVNTKCLKCGAEGEQP